MRDVETQKKASEGFHETYARILFAIKSLKERYSPYMLYMGIRDVHGIRDFYDIQGIHIFTLPHQFWVLGGGRHWVIDITLSDDAYEITQNMLEILDRAHN